MSDLTPGVANDRSNRPRRRPRLWPWFVAGFLLVFVAISVACSTHFYDGFGLHQIKIWRYYLLELQRACAPVRHLGPASDSSSAAAMFALQHIAISLGGGTLLLGVGWVIKRRSR